MTTRVLFAAVALAASTIGVTQSGASTFFAWEVANLNWGDTLNVRKWPSAQSQKRAAYPAGTVLSMTGKCKGAPTLLNDIAHLSDHEQADAVRYKWCEVWHDPSGQEEYETGWIYMKYAKPAQ